MSLDDMMAEAKGPWIRTRTALSGVPIIGHGSACSCGCCRADPVSAGGEAAMVLKMTAAAPGALEGPNLGSMLSMYLIASPLQNIIACFLSIYPNFAAEECTI